MGDGTADGFAGIHNQEDNQEEKKKSGCLSCSLLGFFAIFFSVVCLVGIVCVGTGFYATLGININRHSVDAVVVNVEVQIDAESSTTQYLVSVDEIDGENLHRTTYRLASEFVQNVNILDELEKLQIGARVRLTVSGIAIPGLGIPQNIVEVELLP